jgi:hypothetical protein
VPIGAGRETIQRSKLKKGKDRKKEGGWGKEEHGMSMSSI